MDLTAVSPVAAAAAVKDATWMARAWKNVLLANREKTAIKVCIDSYCHFWLLNWCTLLNKYLFITTACPSTQYGPDCRHECSGTLCLNDYCHPVNSFCTHGCSSSRYYGPFCRGSKYEFKVNCLN